jgi:aminoglycoside phosphotransferase (APT) family kinase protein
MVPAPLTETDLGALDHFLRAQGVARTGELSAELIAGGRSNLTFMVADDGSKWVLRRPPEYGLTPSAHDMAREYRVVSALADTAVPVPSVVAITDDASILGAPFQMVEFVGGRVVRSADDLDALGNVKLIKGCADALIRVLVDLHTVDAVSVGLGDLGKASGYLERQVRRWGSQWQHVRLDDDPRESDVQRLYSALGRAIPRSGRTAIVHGDYRIDNVILRAHDATQVRAVLDWELSTLGDPLSDVALMCAYRHPALDLILGISAAWTSPRLPDADELAHCYSAVSGQPLANWGFYMGLAYFKLAIIAAGIDFRARMMPGETRNQAGQAVAPLMAAGLASADLNVSQV